MKESLIIGIVNDSDTVNPYQIHTKQPGYFIEIVQVICEALHYLCLFDQAETSIYGSYWNGSWTGVIKSISDGTYNTSAQGFTPTIERIRDYTFPSVQFNFPMIFAVRKTHSSTFDQILTPFKQETWLIVLTCAIMICLVMQIEINNVYKLRTVFSNVKYLLNSLIAVLLFLIRKGTKFYWNLSLAFKGLVTLWGFSSLIITASYSGSLLSSLLTTRNELPFTNFVTMIDCVERGKCKMVVFPANEYILSVFEKGSNDSENARLHKALKNNEPIKAKNVIHAYNQICSDSTNYFLFTLFFDYSGFLKENCPSVITFTSSFTDIHTFPFRKNDPLAKEFGEKLLQLYSTGIENRIRSKYYTTASRSDKNPKRIVLGLVGLSGAIIALVIGNFLGVLAFFGEFFSWKFNYFPDDIE